MTSIVAVRTALASCSSEHVTLFTTLIDNGSLIPYKSRDNARRKFGLDTEYAALGKKQAPAALRKQHLAKELQDICLRDLPEAREYFGQQLTYFVSSGGTIDLERMGEEGAGTQTIASLTDTTLGGTDTIVTFPSRTLEKLVMKDYEAPTNCLRASGTTCTVLPTNAYIPLHHSNEGMTTRTLLSGSIVWIIWPSTPKNLRILQNAYEDFAQHFNDSRLDVTNTLEGGMIFVQTEGDGLRISPFTIMMCLSTKTSVLATYSDITAENYLSMLHKLPLLNAWFRTEFDGARKQSEFNAMVLLHLDLMLHGDPKNEERDRIKLSHVRGGLLDKLTKSWEVVKNDVAAILGAADHKTMIGIWVDYLIAAKGRECRLCGDSIMNKQKLMMDHFIERHWFKGKKDTEGVHTRQGLAQGLNEASTEATAQVQAAEEVDGGDAMELDG
ncbi:hypothetical protein BDU57DRAFT_575832 [Ampelomyces quisqualis]|uniref:Uncharacterized protein n=1 Tax=Ampelomyces quisqualis TaxID=50730 RepID=A0A6A5QT43_AMPQU|nr:hypothetical protein BDU57DRAFT_575832 [Ampelomyces quisqualis]